MHAFPAANRLAPLLALVTAACNVSDSGISSSVPQGRFAPRLVVAGNRLSQSDSVYLQLWTRSNSQAAWAPAASLGRSWSDSSIEVDSLPVGALWKASIAGVSAKDTLWKGTDSGVIAATATEQNLQDTASRVHVRNVASRPDTAGLPTSLVAGSSFTLPGTGKIVHAWGSDLPNCAGGDSGRTIVVDTAHTVLRLRVCGDTSLTWPSAVVTRKFSLLAVAPPRLSLTDSDSLLTTSPVTKMAVRAWNAAVGLVHPARTTLSWEISLDSSGQKDTSSGDSLRIPRAWLASLPATGTSFIARAFVRLKDSAGTPVDSAHVRWLVTVPVTPTPALSHRLSQNSDTLIHTWNTHDSSTFLLKTGSTLVTEELANTVTEHRAQVKPGDTCSVRLIAYDSATGRRSDTARDAARVPLQPHFTATNTNTTYGYVALTIDTAGQAGARWAYGYRDITGSAILYADTLKGDSAVLELNSGRWIIGVRALRDGLWRDSLCTLSVTRTLAARPGKPTGLVLSGRTDSSLTWVWDTLPRHSYTAYHGIGDTIPTDIATEAHSPYYSSGTFTYGSLRANQSAWIAVISTSLDSTGSPSSSVGLVSKTLNSPATGLKVESLLQETVGDTAFNVSWDARSGVTFQLTVTPKSGIDTVQNIQGSSAHVSTTPGESYRLTLKVLGDKDSANPSNAVTLDTIARKAPDSVTPSVSWNKETLSLTLTWKVGTSAASFKISDDSAFFSPKSIANNWASTDVASAVFAVAPAQHSGNLLARIVAVGKNGLASKSGTASFHIPQQLPLDTTHIDSWMSGHIARVLLYQNAFASAPASIRVSAVPSDASLQSVNQPLTNISSAGTLTSLDLGGYATTWALHIDATWANGDTTTTLNRLLNYTDTASTKLHSFMDALSLSSYSQIDASTNQGGDSVTTPEDNSYMYIVPSAKISGTWQELHLGTGYAFSKVDSVSAQQISLQPNNTRADTSETLVRPFIPSTLRDTRNTTLTNYPVVQLAGHTIMAQNLDYVLQTDGVTHNSDHPEYGSYFTWKAATDSSRSSQGVCAYGWHVPRRQELADLYNMPAGVLVGLTDGGTNTLGFNGLSSGHYGGSTLSNSGSGGYLQMLSADVQSGNLYAVFSLKASGWASGGASITDSTSFYTVRCIKDN